MPRFIWAIPCHQVITDRETNATSYITCVEGFTLPGFPFPFPPIFVGTLWEKSADDDEVEMRIRVLSPTGDVLHTRAHPRKPFGEYGRYRINIRMGGFDVSEPGEYTLQIEHKSGDTWHDDFQLPLVIELLDNDEDEAE